ncbi:hypothetical protein [Sporosarcina sp. NPDC096371]|uniref:hypothetical protein n=1 Tax=Sporosarcina sp. NPDC096371 TaxID=3364530 RepID=UPI003810B35C
MNKTIQWIIWALALVAINIPTILMASFSLFGTAEGTSIFSVDYLIAAGILLLGNIIILQLFLAIHKGHYQGFVIGLCAAVAQTIGLYLMGTVSFTAGFSILVGSILVAIGLLFWEIKSP